MEITSISSFLTYYERTRLITSRVIDVIPPDQLNWTYKAGKFTIGDLVRHIAAIERYVFAEVAQGRASSYKGCGRDLADGYENVLRFFNSMHFESAAIFKQIKDEDLSKKIRALDGREVELGHFLRALIIHEVHHRGALCIYLNLLDVETPPIIGLKEEQVIALSKSF